MRYIPIEALREGMVLARPLYGNNFEVLLGEELTLSSVHIQRINKLGYAGVYIMDELSEGICVRDVIPTQVRLNLIRAAKEAWQQAERGISPKGSAKSMRAKQDRIVMPVIEALIDNPKRLVELTDLKPEEDYLYYHAANGVVLSVLIGVEMGLSGTQLYELALAALLHDVGNIFIPRAILDKPGKLTPEEYAIIKSHTDRGFDYLRDNYEISIEGCMGALQHHENYDGSGYPNGLKRDKISIYGRIIAITDVYDALTSRRPFRKMLYPAAAMDYLNTKAGTMFDPDIIATFQRVVPRYPAGMCVEMNSGVRGIVVENRVGYPDRPKVMLLNRKADKPLVMDLQGDGQYKDSVITSIIEQIS